MSIRYDDDGYDDFGFFDNDDGPQFGDNFKDRERVNFGIEHPLLMNTKLGNLRGDDDLGKLQERFFKISASPEEKFAHILYAIFNQYKDELKFTDETIIEMLDAVMEIRNIYYKNPMCFLLGYFIVEAKPQYGKDNKILSRAQMNMSNYNFIIENIINSHDITKTDIIRYCRLWIDYYNKK